MKPLFKAAGGKTKLLPEILKRVPEFDGAYHEPFLGGGAVFAALGGAALAKGSSLKGWTLNDSNAELMNAYRVCKDDCAKLVAALQAIKHSKENYYAVRTKEETTDLGRAVRFSYLNRTCFNGLWRVNGAGKFNVPIGSYKDPMIVDPKNFSYWSKLLADVDLFAGDFEPRIDAAKVGDFVYVDPPYLPRSKTASFERYTAGGFKLKEHERLAASLASAHKRGVKFVASQGDGETVRALYKECEIIAVSVTHSIAAKKSSRIKVGEVLISNCA
jgi:DNA adenine methylase